ncbi:MAG: hemerythrin-like domain-containing protein [Limisphaerales bacterium]|jgi:hemerythrin-like domain-containing protein
MTNWVLDRLEQDHERISVVLDLIEAEFAKFESDDQEQNLIAIADALAYIEAYPDAVHHPVEECLFDMLAPKTSGGVSLAIDELRQQHRTIVNATRTLKTDVDNILNDIVTPINVVMKHLSEYAALQREHMAMEGKTVFPIAADTLSESEWTELRGKLDQVFDPLFVKKTKRFNYLYTAVVETFGTNT